MRCRYHWFLNNNNNNNENKNNSNRKIAAAAAVLWCCCCCCVLLLLAAASLLVTCCGTHRNSIGTTTTTTLPSSDENIDSAHLFLRSSSSASASAATAAASVRAPARAPATAPAPASATTEELSDTDMIIITYDSSSSSSSSNSNNDDNDSDNESNKNNNNDHDHHDHSHTTLLYDSIDKHNRGSVHKYKKISVGAGREFWSQAQDETEHEKVRGWMYRFRAVVAAIAAEYRARGEHDYIAVVADAYDVYVPDTEHSNALDLLRRKFLTAFGDSRIVFSGQMYCCNPWNLRAAARADWDDHYGNNMTATGRGPATLYKHLNAGLYMGYATALMKMADDMNVWDTVYERPEYFDDMMIQQQPQQEENGTGTAAAVVLPRMKDIHVDDDEWQISAWYLEQQQRSMAASQSPVAVIDQQQVLFSVSATQRATFRESGFLISSVADYFNMIGRLPADFDASADLRRVTDCPYAYDADTATWTNTVTGSHPVLFHFAGSHWLCACQVFRQQGYKDTSAKFHEYCHDETAVTYWKDAVEQGIMSVSAAAAADHHHRDRQLFVTTAAADDGMTDNGNSHNDNNHVGDDSAASGAGARLLFRQPRTGPRIVPVSSLQYTP